MSTWQPTNFGEVRRDATRAGSGEFRHLGILAGREAAPLEYEHGYEDAPYSSRDAAEGRYPQAIVNSVRNFPGLGAMARATTNSGPLIGGLTWGALGALLGAAGGAGSDTFRNVMTGSDQHRGTARMAALAGGVGAGLLGAYAAHRRVPDDQYPGQVRFGKQASTWFGSDQTAEDRAAIIAALYRDHGIPLDQRQLLAEEIRQLSGTEAAAVKRKILMAGGFGVGALLARLFGFGAVGTGVSGLLGAAVGARSARRTDALGREYF